MLYIERKKYRTNSNNLIIKPHIQEMISELKSLDASISKCYKQLLKDHFNIIKNEDALIDLKRKEILLLNYNIKREYTTKFALPEYRKVVIVFNNEDFVNADKSFNNGDEALQHLFGSYKDFIVKSIEKCVSERISSVLSSTQMSSM